MLADAGATAHRGSMTLSADAIGPLIEELALQPSVRAKGARFLPPGEARFHEVSPGTLAWDWCDRNSTERALRSPLAYYDLDGQIVMVSVVIAQGAVTEIELCRGDDQPIQTTPQSKDLWEMIEGVTYSPRT